MSKVTIEVVGKELDLADGIGFGLNYAIDDVKKIENKNSNYSKTITLAGSKKNNKILGGLFDINSDFTFFNPNFKIDAKIIVDSSTVMKGFLQLKSIEKDTDNFQDGNNIVYKCVVSSASADFFTAIKDKKLEDLDFNRFDHVYGRTNILGSWTNTSAQGYVYPLLYKNSNDYGTQDFKPAIFHKAYLKRIAQEAGYTLSGSLMDESTDEGFHYAKEIIPFNGELPTITDEEYERRLFRAGLTVDKNIQSETITSSYPYGGFSGFNESVADLNIFDNDSTGVNFDNDTHWNTSTSEYTVDVNGSYNLQLSVEANLTYSTASIEAYQSVVTLANDGDVGTRNFNANHRFYLYFEIYKNGARVAAPVFQSIRAARAATQGSSDPTFTAANSYTVVDNFTSIINAPNLSLKDTDVVTVKYRIQDTASDILQYTEENTGTTGLTDVPVTYTMEAVNSASTFILNSTNAGALTDGNTIILSDFIPKEVKQSDIVKDIVTRCNAYISVDPDNDRKIVIDTREAYYAKGGLVDWTGKQDYESKTDIKLLSELQNKEFLFTFKADSDDYNKNYSDSVSKDIYGQQTVEFANEFVEGVKKIESPFSPTPLIYNSTSYPCAIVPAISTAAPKTNVRVLYYGGVIDCQDGGWDYSSWESGVITTTTQLTYPYAGHLDNPINPTIDINFGEVPFEYYSGQQSKTNATLYSRFWANYIQQIDEGKLASMSMNLTEVDISFIRNNLNTKIWVKDSYYYVNKIIDYNPLSIGLTKVELLKINDGVSFVSSNTVKVNNENPYEIEMKSQQADEGDNSPYDNYNGSRKSSVSGKNNSVGEGSDSSTVKGNDNAVGADSRKAMIYGDRNTVASGVENAYIIGANDKEVLEEGEGWIGETHYKNGKPVNALPYKIYSALLTQSGTNAPTNLILENTFSALPTPAYVATGVYTVDLVGAFTIGKTVVVSNINDDRFQFFYTEVISEDQIVLRTENDAQVFADGVLSNAFLEIRVYS